MYDVVIVARKLSAFSSKRISAASSSLSENLDSLGNHRESADRRLWVVVRWPRIMTLRMG